MRLAVAAAGAAVLVVASVLAIGGRLSLAADQTVDVGDNFFEDADDTPGDNVTTINVGDTVTWEWLSGALHTITADDGSFDTGFQSGGTFQRTFNTAGAFGYHCQLHGAPGAGSMFGTIIVQEIPTNTPQPTNTLQPTNTSAPGTTNTATRTPTRTSTPQPTSTGSVTPVPTIAAATSTPAAADLTSTEEVLGTSARPVLAPDVGTGDATARDGWLQDELILVMATVGILLIVGAAVGRVRR
jgi:plastocyanin